MPSLRGGEAISGYLESTEINLTASLFNEIILKYDNNNIRCIAYADDLAALVSAVAQKVLATRAEEAYAEISRWIASRNIEIAANKT